MKEAAEGQSFLAMAGFEVNEILAAMPAMLDLAGAGQLELGAAADIASNILSGFGMEADQAGHMANVLAKAASSANTDVSQLGEAMVYLAPSANALGWEIEESAAAVQVFSDAGIQGSMAGRAFATSLQRLAKPTAEMQKKMDELGIEFFDAQGNLKPLTEVVGDLEGSFEGLTAEQQANALTTLFGAEAFKHWENLVSKGSDELIKMEDALVNSNDAAKNMRETMEDNLHGDWAKFVSALQEGALVVYTAIAPALRELLQYLTKVVEWLANLSPQTQKMIVMFVGFLAVLGPIILILGKFAMAIGSIITLGSKVFGVFAGITKAFGLFGGVIGKAGPLLARFAPMLVRLLTMIPRLFNPVGLAITAFIFIFKGLLKAFDLTPGQVIEGLVKGFTEGIPFLWETAKNLGRAIIDAFKEMLGIASPSTVFYQLGVWVIEGLINGVNAMISLVIELFSSMARAVIEIVENIVATVIEFFIRLINWIRETFGALVSWFAEIWSAILQIFIDFVNDVITLITNFVNELINWFISLYNEVVRIVSLLVTAVVNAFNSMVRSAIQAGENIVNAIVGAFRDAWNGAMEFVRKATSLGKDFALGIASGITSGAKFLKDAVVGIGKSAIDSFKSFFDIRSPSKVMEGEARWLPEGIASGIAKGASKVDGAMKKVGEIAKSGYRAVTQNLPTLNLPNVPSVANILPSTREAQFSGVPVVRSERRRGADETRDGDVIVNVRKLEDASPQAIQNKVERRFFRKARQRE